MASCDLHSALVLCFFIVFRISLVASNNDFMYDTGPQRVASLIEIKLLNNHNLQKRNIEILFPNTTPVIVKNNYSVTAPSRINIDKEAKSDLTSLNLSSTDRVPQQLGVNGSGQRRFDITTSTPYKAPPLVHDIGSTMDDVRNKKNEMKNKNNDFSVEEHENDYADFEKEFLDNFDTSEDDIEKNLHEMNNMTVIKNDTHVFYNSTIYTDPEIGQSYWIDMDRDKKGTVNDLLSNSHRRAATIKLSFDFPFYGHLIKNVTIATGGFIYTGNYVHSWLAATQYIAPLMANFDTSLSNQSNIRHYDNGTAFTVEWQRVQLKDKPNDGEFTFQVTLLKNGDVIFVYKNVPLHIKDIEDIHHPVKIGLSDAYILDKTMYYIRRKTIYEYHRVAFKKEEIKNWTSIHLTALPTCHSLTNCNSCVTGEIAETHKCKWCPKLNQCSTGYDRNRQDWVAEGCDMDHVGYANMCHIRIVPGDHYETTFSYNPEVLGYNSRSKYEVNHSTTAERIGMSGWLAVLFLVIMGTGLALWVLYAYRNPHSFSGQILIRYRPSQWRWRRGEARYTAATIHM